MKRALLCMALLFSAAASADETWYVHTSVDGSGDDGSEAAPYDTLAQAEAAKEGSLTGRGVVTFYVDGSTAETAAVSLAGFTDADSSNYVRVICQDPPEGVWDTGRYRIDVSTNYAAALAVPSYTRLYGLQLRASGTSSNALSTGTSTNTVIDRCILRSVSGYGVNISANSNTVRNCVFAGGTQAIHLGTSKYSNVFVNCTGINVGYGIYAPGGSNSATNCYFSGSTAAYYTTGTLTLTNCYSNDGSLSTTTAACATDSGAYFTNVTAGSEDVHIGTDSALHDTGADASGLLDPDEDCDGETRPLGNECDVGADEFTETGGKAYSPVPATAATNQARSTALSWTSGTNATSHHVYFGTDSTPDNDGGSSEYQGEQVGTTFDPTGLLEYGTTYYWRIDEEDAEENVVTGTVWSFTTLPAGATYYASPSGGGSGEDADHPATLSALTDLLPGDTIILAAGDYGDWTAPVAGNAEDPITYQAAAALQPTFDSVTISVDYVVVEGLSVSRATGGYIVSVSGDGCKFDAGRIAGTLVSGYIQAPAYSLLVTGDDVVIEDTESYYGVDNFELQANVTVRRCRVHDNLSSAVKVTHAGITVEYCDVFNSRPSLEEPDGDPEHGTGISIRASEATIRGNLIYNYGTSRALRSYQDTVDAYTDLLIENNIVLEDLTYDFTESGINTYTEFWDVGERCVLRNNTFDSLVRFGLCDPNGTHTPGEDVVIANNLFLGSLELVGDHDSGDWRTNPVSTNLTLIEAAVTNGMVEAGNIAGSLNVAGGGYFTGYDWDDIWPGSTSVENSSAEYWAVGAMFANTTGSLPYNLCAGSPAINGGSAAEGHFSTTDYLGNSRASTPDIGAIEYGASTPPAQAATPSPANEATGVAVDVTLSWGAVSGANRYDVYVSADATIDDEDYQSDMWAGLVAFTGASAPVVSMVGIGGVLEAWTTYYWRVDAIDHDEGIVVGDVWSFTTGSGSVSRPVRARGVRRPDGATGRRIRWRR